jgi:hypothetical protein
VAVRSCIVFVPTRNGKANYAYHTSSESSFGAAWDALQQHEAIHKSAVADDAILHVVVNGKDPQLHNFREWNSKQPNFRHKAGPGSGVG